MNILAIDTCFTACSVCVAPGDPEHDVVGEYAELGTGHGEALTPMIARTMSGAGVRFDQLDRIAVTIGPGSFTGVRIGLAAARALLLATPADIVSESSLHVMALGALRRLGPDQGEPQHAGQDICVAVDAKRDQLYLQCFRPDATALGPPKILGIQDLRNNADSIATALQCSVVVGSGAPAFAEIAALHGRTIAPLYEDLWPDATDLVHLAPDLAASARPPAPLYLRPPDAKPQEGASVARVR